jgi:hypothetical protein
MFQTHGERASAPGTIFKYPEEKQRPSPNPSEWTKHSNEKGGRKTPRLTATRQVGIKELYELGVDNRKRIDAPRW